MKRNVTFNELLNSLGDGLLGLYNSKEQANIEYDRFEAAGEAVFIYELSDTKETYIAVDKPLSPEMLDNLQAALG